MTETLEAMEPMETYTELGNAKRFSTVYGLTNLIENSNGAQMSDVSAANNENSNTYVPILKYVLEYKRWAVFDGIRWVCDGNQGADVQCAYENVVAGIQCEELQALLHIMDVKKEAGYELSEEKKEELQGLQKEAGAISSWIYRCQSRSVINNTISLAQNQPNMSSSITEFDKDGSIFTCKNQVIDLRTGNTVNPSPHFMNMKFSDVVYDPAATCEQWLAFLQQIMNSNEDKIRFLQKIAGQAMLGCEKDKFFIFTGSGANGKSTFMDTLNTVLGDYTSVIAPDVLMQTHNNSKDFARAEIRGLRMMLMQETEEGQILDCNLVKQLTDSGDMQAAQKFGNPFTFQPTATPVLCTNNMPVMSDDPALWRRTYIVDFDYTVPEAERNSAFKKALLTEASGILNWCIEGAMLYQQEGWAVPECIKTYTQTKRDDIAVLKPFFDEILIDEMLIPEIGKVTEADVTLIAKNKSPLIRDVYHLYKDWCKFSGYAPLGAKKFNAKLRSNGYTVETGNNNKTVLRGYMLPLGLSYKPIETFELWRMFDKADETLMRCYENKQPVPAAQETGDILKKLALNKN